MRTDAVRHDAIVVGAGPAGLVTGLALAQSGLTVAVVGPPGNVHDARTAALFDTSITFLKRLNVWPLIESASARIAGIRIADATNHLLKAPEICFMADEIGLDAFGYNVPNGALAGALEQAVAEHPAIMRIMGAAHTIDIRDDEVVVTTGSAKGALGSGPGISARHESMQIVAKLIAGADGRDSPSRIAAGIPVQSWRYPQAAVVCHVTHSRAHDNISSELHRRAGPLTVVPMPGRASSLVWVETPAEAERLAALSDADFAAELKPHVSGLLGTLQQLTPRRTFPLSGQTAARLADHRVALIGEAGHVIPPIGAQGLNLSLRDAATLAELAADARERGQDVGGAAVMAAFDSRRRADVTARVWSIDLMNRSLLSEYMPVSVARGFAIAALSSIGPLRRMVMREGVSPALSTPVLMRPDPRPAAL